MSSSDEDEEVETVPPIGAICTRSGNRPEVMLSIADFINAQKEEEEEGEKRKRRRMMERREDKEDKEGDDEEEEDEEKENIEIKKMDGKEEGKEDEEGGRANTPHEMVILLSNVEIKAGEWLILNEDPLA